MHYRTLKEAIEIASSHLTPADMAERAMREKRKAEADARRKDEESRELGWGRDAYSIPFDVLYPISQPTRIHARLEAVFGPINGAAYKVGRLVEIDFYRGPQFKIPEWANWLAVEADGKVVVFGRRPYDGYINDIDRLWRLASHFEWCQIVAYTSPRTDWHDTLCPLTEQAWKEWKGKNGTP